MASGRRSRSFWEKLVAQAAREGSIDAVASRHGVVAKQLAWWRWWLEREKRAKPKPRTKAKPKTRTKAKPRTRVESKTRRSEPRMLPVVIEPAPTVTSGAIEIAVRDVRLRVEAGTEPGYVATLVDVLRRC